MGNELDISEFPELYEAVKELIASIKDARDADSSGGTRVTKRELIKILASFGKMFIAVSKVL